MQNAFSMRVVHSLTDGGEEEQPLLHRALHATAEIRHGLPVHKFHGIPRTPACGRAGIIHSGDARVLQMCECLALYGETERPFRRIQFRAQQLQRHLAMHRHRLLREEDFPHATLAYFLQETVSRHVITSLRSPCLLRNPHLQQAVQARRARHPWGTAPCALGFGDRIH